MYLGEGLKKKISAFIDQDEVLFCVSNTVNLYNIYLSKYQIVVDLERRLLNYINVFTYS